jgi:proteasome accessory factor C
VTTATDTAGRLRRLLAILAWLAQVGEAPIDRVAERFDLSPQALVTELELAACCGVPPYSPDQLMEIVVNDTTVSTKVGTALARPRRLSPSEGFALAASARALLAVPGSDEDGALSRALAKLDRALGGEEVAVELDTPPFLPLVAEALESGSGLAVSYYSASTDKVTEREIRPLRMFGSEGHWYVDALCASAGGIRRFRIDRINAAARVEGGGPVPEALSGDGGPVRTVSTGEGAFEAFVPGPDSRRVRLSLEPAAAWLVESVPSAGPTEELSGRIELELFVGGDAWLERLLLRLGPDARVVGPPEYLGLAADAAGRILERYRAMGTDPPDS